MTEFDIGHRVRHIDGATGTVTEIELVIHWDDGTVNRWDSDELEMISVIDDDE